MTRDTFVYHLFPLGQCGAPARNDFSSPPVERLDELHPWLEHARDLGASTVLLGPVFESSSHGYDTADLGQVDRRLGTNQGLARLVARAHELGLRVMLDAVFGHVGRHFHAFRDLLERGAQSAFTGWFRNLRFDRRGPLGDPFECETWKGVAELPRLDLGSPAVRAHLFGEVDRWVRDLGVDGLRLDTADWLDHGFLEALRAHCDQLRPDLWLMGEVVHGDYRGWVQPNQLHSVTNYECYKGLWSSLNDRNAVEIAYALQRQFGTGGLYQGQPLYNFVDNHDVSRVASLLRERAHLFPLYGLLFTMPGVPSVYYGSEFGIGGLRTASDDRPIRPRLSLEELRSGDQSVLEAVRRFARLRHGSAALARGAYAQLHVAGEQLAFLRTEGQERVVVALNAAAQPAAVPLPGLAGRRLVDLLDPGTPVAVSGGLKLELPGRWLRVLRVEG